jgi:hypothetical protein
MRFRTLRAWSLALSLAALGLGLATATQARADWPIHTIPRLAPAYNFTTGGEFMAPPVPYGHYAKDYVGEAQKCMAGMQAHLAGLCGHFKGHHGTGDGCEGPGCGGAFGHNGGSGCGDPGCFGGISCGIMGHRKHGGSADGDSGAGYATTISGPSAQTIAAPSAQALCGQAGCNVGGKHSHLGNFGGHSGCGDPGCGLGFAHSHGNGNGYGDGNGGCSFCGGKGCKHCMGNGGGHGSMIHGKLASLAAGLHHPKLTWFVGAGGPVPLTPGYVPYIVTTRSPRDFFAFPPMNPNAP